MARVTPEKLQSLALFYARQMVEQHHHSISRIREVMATSLTIEHAPRIPCQWPKFGAVEPCARAANYQVVRYVDDHPIGAWKVCYRHRWRMRDWVQQLIDHPGPRLSEAIESKSE